MLNSSDLRGVFSPIDRRIRGVFKLLGLVAFVTGLALGGRGVEGSPVWSEVAAWTVLWLALTGLVSNSLHVHKERNSVALVVMLGLWALFGSQSPVSVGLVIAFGFALVIWELTIAVTLALGWLKFDFGSTKMAKEKADG